MKLRQVLPNSVHLVDRGARAQQLVRHFLKLGQWDFVRRARRERRSAPGDHTEHQVAFVGVAGRFQQAPGRRLPTRVGHGMAGFDNLDLPGRRGVAILGNDQTAGNTIAQDVHQGRGHARAGLAGAKHDHAPGVGIRHVDLPEPNAVAVQRYGLANRRCGVHGGNSRPPDRHNRGAHRLIPHVRRLRPGQHCIQCRQHVSLIGRNRPARRDRDRRARP